MAADQPLLCLIDDASVDRTSAQVLAFVARRGRTRSALIFGTRDPDVVPGVAGLPELPLEGLSDADAEPCCASVIPGGSMNESVTASSRSPAAIFSHYLRCRAPSPLRNWPAVCVSAAPTLASRIEQSFQRRIAPLPEVTRHLLLLAAAEPTGDPALLWRASGQLGISPDAVGPAEADRLLTVGAKVTFLHPLVRSAVYQSARRPAAAVSTRP